MFLMLTGGKSFSQLAHAVGRGSHKEPGQQAAAGAAPGPGPGGDSEKGAGGSAPGAAEGKSLEGKARLALCGAELKIVPITMTWHQLGYEMRDPHGNKVSGAPSSPSHVTPSPPPDSVPSHSSPLAPSSTPTPPSPLCSCAWASDRGAPSVRQSAGCGAGAVLVVCRASGFSRASRGGASPGRWWPSLGPRARGRLRCSTPSQVRPSPTGLYCSVCAAALKGPRHSLKCCAPRTTPNP